jgi:hypothetical protein
MSRVVELRQYTLKRGMRDTLVELFDREFLESQEACGCDVIGQFRDLNIADRFVWLRGFADMEARGKALAAFYGGSVWKAHRDAANATMVDSDNVLLLRPVRPEFDFADGTRPPLDTPARPSGVVTATVCRFDERVDEDTAGHVIRSVSPVLCEAGAPALAWLMTEYAANNFPALPVRDGENAVVWVSPQPRRPLRLPPPLLSLLQEHPVALRLAPTARSKLRAAA